MDFKRIQTLLLVFFVIFDFYLIHMLFTRTETFVTESQIQEVTTIEENLQTRGVTFDEFSEEATTMNLLKTDQNNYLAEQIIQLENQDAAIDTNGILTSTFDQPVDLGLGIDSSTTGLSEEQYNHIAENFLNNESLFIEGTQYTSYWYVPSDRLIILRLTDGEGHSIVDGTAGLRISLNENFEMTGYTQTFQSNIVDLTTEVEVMSERSALEVLDRRVETFIPDNAHIISNSLSYYRSTSLETFNVYSPAWEILYYLSDGTTRSVLVDASRGTVINRDQIVSE